jgi:hypothetical protein
MFIPRYAEHLHLLRSSIKMPFPQKKKMTQAHTAHLPIIEEFYIGTNIEGWDLGGGGCTESDLSYRRPAPWTDRHDRSILKAKEKV